MVRQDGGGGSSLPGGGNGGSGVPGGGKGGSGVTGMCQSGGGIGGVVMVPDNGGALDLVDDGLAGNGIGVRHGDGLGHVVGGGNLNNFLDGFDHVIRDIVGFLHMDGLVDGVDLLLDSNLGKNGRFC